MEIHKLGGQADRWTKQFIRLPHSLYKKNRYWVPPFNIEMKRVIGKEHPYYEHSDGEFFVAVKDGEPAGRIAVFENTLFNKKHGSNAATFYYFDCIENEEVSHNLFVAASTWARDRGLDHILGPMFSGGTSGSGILIEGFEERAAMTMMGYNYPYYQRLIEAEGFEKRRDYISALIDGGTFAMPDKINRLAEISLNRGHFEVLRFDSKKDILPMAKRIGELYNSILGSFNESHHLTAAEIEDLTKSLLAVADPKLIKVLTYDGEIAGFTLAFRDLSAALQRGRGRMNPISMLRLLREFKKTRNLIFNGIGILPQYQRLGGNALLYKELEKTVRNSVKNPGRSDITQIAETTWLMLEELENLGAKIYKRHRLYEKEL